MRALGPTSAGTRKPPRSGSSQLFVAPLQSLEFVGVHRPADPSYKTPAGSQLLLLFFFLFFFILTLIDTGELKHTLLYNGEPALHIVVLAVMNCPSGPFRSEFLMSNPISFRCDRCFSSDMEKKTRRENGESGGLW